MLIPKTEDLNFQHAGQSCQHVSSLYFSMFTGCLDLPSNYLIGNHVIYLPAMTFKEVPDMLADILNPFLKVQTSKC